MCDPYPAHPWQLPVSVSKWRLLSLPIPTWWMSFTKTDTTPGQFDISMGTGFILAGGALLYTKTEEDTGHILNDVLCELLSFSPDLTPEIYSRSFRSELPPGHTCNFTSQEMSIKWQGKLISLLFSSNLNLLQDRTVLRSLVSVLNVPFLAWDTPLTVLPSPTDICLCGIWVG